MANNSMFAQVGPTPGVLGGNVSMGGTPPPRSTGQLTSGTINLGQGSATDSAIKLGGNSGLIQPSTPLKKTIIQNADGSTITQEHHLPPKVTPPPSGTNGAGGNGAGNPDPNQPQALTPQQISDNTKVNNTNTYGGTGNALTVGGQAQNVLNAGQQTPLEQEYIKEVMQAKEMQNAGALGSDANASMYTGDTSEQLYNNLINSPGLASDKTQQEGLYNTFGNIYGSAATQGLTAANTIANRGLAANQSVLGAVAPTMQFGQLTSPVTGAPITGGNFASNPQLQSAVQQAVQLVQNGTPPNDPAVQSLLSTFGLPGQQAFTTAMQQASNGTYNPTAQSAVSQSNASQGVDYKQQAVNLDTSLQQLDAASTLADNFLTNNKLLNPTDNPNFNAGINTYVGTFNDPAARLQYNAILGDIKKFTSTILASNNGSIPTDVTNTLNSFDPSTLSAPQLKPYLEALAQLGNNQKSVLQTQIGNLIPGQNNNYTGSPTSINTTPIATPQSTQTLGSKITNPTVQGYAGTIMNIAGGVTGVIKGLANHVLGL